MWLSAIKLAVSAGSKIYANKQKTKMAMSEAQLMHASRMAEGKEAYQGKEKNLKAWKKLWEEENMLLLRLWIKIVEKKHKEKLCQ
jgi:hypothetical protein